jgi:hypothetical protein
MNIIGDQIHPNKLLVVGFSSVCLSEYLSLLHFNIVAISREYQ